MALPPVIQLLREEMARYKTEFIRLINRPPTHASLSNTAETLDGQTGEEVKDDLLGLVLEHVNKKGVNVHNLTPAQLDTFTKAEYDGYLSGLNQGEIPISYYGDMDSARPQVTAGDVNTFLIQNYTQQGRTSLYLQPYVGSNGDLIIRRPQGSTYWPMAYVRNSANASDLTPVFSTHQSVASSDGLAKPPVIGYEYISYNYIDKARMAVPVGQGWVNAGGTGGYSDYSREDPTFTEYRKTRYLSCKWTMGSHLSRGTSDGNVYECSATLYHTSGSINTHRFLGWRLTQDRLRETMQRKNLGGATAATELHQTCRVYKGSTYTTGGAYITLFNGIQSAADSIASVFNLPAVAGHRWAVFDAATINYSPVAYSEFDVKTGILFLRAFLPVDITLTTIATGAIQATKRVYIKVDTDVHMYMDASSGAITPYAYIRHWDTRPDVTYVNGVIDVNLKEWGSDFDNCYLNIINKDEENQVMTKSALGDDNTLYIVRQFSQNQSESITRVRYDPSLKPIDIFGTATWIPGSEQTTHYESLHRTNIRPNIATPVMLTANKFMYKTFKFNTSTGTRTPIVCVRESPNIRGRTHIDVGASAATGLQGPVKTYTETELPAAFANQWRNLLIETEMGGGVQVSQSLFTKADMGIGARSTTLNEDGTQSGSVFVSPTLLQRLIDEFRTYQHNTNTISNVTPQVKTTSAYGMIVVPQKFSDVPPLLIMFGVGSGIWQRAAAVQSSMTNRYTAVYALNVTEGSRNNILNATVVGGFNNNKLHWTRADLNYWYMGYAQKLREDGAAALLGRAQVNLVKTATGYMLMAMPDTTTTQYANNVSYQIMLNTFTTNPSEWLAPPNKYAEWDTGTTELPTITYTQYSPRLASFDDVYFGNVYDSLFQFFVDPSDGPQICTQAVGAVGTGTAAINRFSMLIGSRLNPEAFSRTGQGFLAFAPHVGHKFQVYGFTSPGDQVRRVFMSEWTSNLEVKFHETSAVIDGHYNKLAEFVKVFVVPADVGVHHVWVYLDANGMATYDIRKNTDVPSYVSKIYIGTLTVTDSNVAIDIRKNLSLFGHIFSDVPKGDAIPIANTLNSPKAGWLYP